MNFGDALVEHIPKLRNYAGALTRDATRIDDLVQDCLVKALGKQHLFEIGADLRAWLFSLLHNQHIDDVRRSILHDSCIAAAQEYVIPAAYDPASRVIIGELVEALSRLPAPMRRALTMVAVDGLEYQEIAKRENISLGTVSSRMYRGRAELAQRLDYHPA